MPGASETIPYRNHGGHWLFGNLVLVKGDTLYLLFFIKNNSSRSSQVASSWGSGIVTAVAWVPSLSPEPWHDWKKKKRKFWHLFPKYLCPFSPLKCTNILSILILNSNSDSTFPYSIPWCPYWKISPC